MCLHLIQVLKMALLSNICIQQVPYLTLLLIACLYGIVKQKFLFKFEKGSSKKFPMSVATMSR